MAGRLAIGPVLQLLLAAVLWSTGGFLIKSVSWNAPALACVRSLIAAATVYVFLGCPPLKWSRANAVGAVCYVGTVMLFVGANKLTTAANAIFLQYTAPVLVAVLGGIFLGERPTRLDWVLIGVVQVGCLLFFFDRLTPEGWMGCVLALASGVSFAGLVLMMRRQRDESPAQIVLQGNLLTGLVGLPFAITTTPGPGAWSGLVILGVFQLGIPYLLYARAIKKVRALESSLISTVEPVLNPIWALWFLGEMPNAWALWGGGLVLGSALVRGIVTALVAEAAAARRPN